MWVHGGSCYVHVVLMLYICHVILVQNVNVLLCYCGKWPHVNYVSLVKIESHSSHLYHLTYSIVSLGVEHEGDGG